MSAKWTNDELHKYFIKKNKKAKAREVKLDKEISEGALQEACVDWFYNAYPQVKRALFHVPNGGYRHKKTGAMLKRQGVKDGVSDLIYLKQNKKYPGLVIEMKRKGKTPTESQIEFIQEMRENGYYTAVIDNYEDFKKLIIDYHCNNLD